LNTYQELVARVLIQPARTLQIFFGIFAASLLLYLFVGLSFFPRTDAGQFVINVKAPSGTKLTETEKEINSLENLIRGTVKKDDLGMIVSNIGLDPGFSA